jgi:hypothetical protein
VVHIGDRSWIGRGQGWSKRHERIVLGVVWSMSLECKRINLSGSRIMFLKIMLASRK